MNTTKPTASHVNTGTSISREELPRPSTYGRVTRLPKLHTEVEESPSSTPYGGLVLAVAFLKQFMVAESIDSRVSVLKQHQPYHESDHVLALALNLYVGGTCLEDLSNLQHSEGVRRMLGACRIPDPTTAGDFLRRFDEDANPGSLAALRQSVDEIQCAVWQASASTKRTKKNKGRHKSQKNIQSLEAIDIDAHLKPVYGVQKEGADFSYKGQWSYKQLLITRARTSESLAVRNRPGNVKDADGAAEVLDEVLGNACSHLGPTLVVRGDSAFDQADMRAVCESRGVYSAIVAREFKDRQSIAMSVPESSWKPFRTRAARTAEQRKRAKNRGRRRRKPNRKRQRALERGYNNKRLLGQWITEVPYQPAGSKKTYRLVLRRRLIEHSEGQLVLFKEYEYRYVLTDLPHDLASTRDVVDLTYERCDQENLVEQMGSGIAGWRMPVREFAGNCAWLEIARLAWNLGKWIAMLALPDEVVRWEWKRFRQAFVYVAAEVVKRSRQTWVRFSDAHRFLDLIQLAHQRLLL